MNVDFFALKYNIMCKFMCEVMMATNLAIDDKIIEEAKKVGGHRTKKAAVLEALEEYIQYHKQQQLVKLFGTITYTSDYDYKTQRNKA
jgi:hypothetical protein